MKLPGKSLCCELRAPAGLAKRLAPIIIGAFLTGCASQTQRATVSPASPLQAPRGSDDSIARKIASDHFLRGKGYALSGDAACARMEFDLAVAALARCDGHSTEDALFARHLFDSIDFYQSALDDRSEMDERPPAENVADSLISTPPPLSAEEIATAKEEAAAITSVASFDIPVVVNDSVLKAIAFYQFRTPQAFAGALKRSGRYLSLMRKVLKDQGLPQDLIYVAMIESAFKSTAHSRAAAHGYWQFIDGTARRYDLRRNRYLDERSDPYKSTLAAAQYFRDLYEMFGDWYLALAAYNTGEGRIIRALQRTGARDYWELSSLGVLHPETKNYVPFFLASAIIAKNPQKFGFDVVTDPPFEFDLVALERPVDLEDVAEAIGYSSEDLRALNPELLTRYSPRGESYSLRVPAGTGPALSNAIASLPAAPEFEERRVAVKRGDTPEKVARRYGMSLGDFREMNGIKAGAKLRKGSTVLVSVQRPRTLRSRGPILTAASAPASGSSRQAPSTRGRSEGEIRALPTPAAAVSSVAGIPASVSQASDNDTRPRPRPLPDTVSIPAEGFVSEARTAPSASKPSKPARQVVQAASVETKKSLSHSRKDRAQKPQTYTVRRGDTLFEIAEKHGVPLETLVKENRLRSRGSLKVGQRLTVPTGTAR